MKKLIVAAKHNQDVVFTRIADRLKDDENISLKSVISYSVFVILCRCCDEQISPSAGFLILIILFILP